VGESPLLDVAHHLANVEKYAPNANAELVGIIEGEQPRAINLKVRSAFEQYRKGDKWFKATPEQLRELKKLFPRDNRLQCWEAVEPWFAQQKN
jgi:hypothetical protein